MNRTDSIRRGLRRLYPRELLWNKYKLTGAQRLVMIVWGLALSQIASPVGSSIYFLITQVSYQVRYRSTVTTLWYLKDTWDRLPVHIQNLLGQHWFASPSAPLWWVDARHDTRHVLIGLIGILLVRSLTIGFKENPRPRASTLRIVLSPFAVLAIGTAVAAALIAFFAKVFPAVLRIGFVSGSTWLTEWLGKDSWQLTLIGVVAGLAAKWAFDPVADTFQLMSIENQLAAGDTERWWWHWFYPPNYRARFAYLKASGHEPQRHGKAMGVALIMSAPVFLFLLGFGIWLVYFGPASTAG
ncbi:MAG: hypothetical protein FWE35_13500 [Streptosporangiales bacterium]|nr:hypothetical protein [Streptosporangiales bacterium]